MIIRATFKTPDVLDYSLADAGLDEDETAEAKEKLSKWIKYGECITVEFDTDKMTAEVQE